MQNRAQFGHRDRWRAVSDPEFWRHAVIATTVVAVSMAILACAVALARDTTGHDWYAAYKITVAEIMIGAGFDEDGTVEYRYADGTVEAVSRSHLRFDFDARWARDRILEATSLGAALGGLSGFGGALLCLVLVWRSMHEPRAGRREYEPAPSRSPAAQDRLAQPAERPMSVPARTMPETLPPSHATAPAHRSPATRPPVSDAPRSARAEPGDTAPARSESSKDDKAKPARRERRNRDHGRWV